MASNTQTMERPKRTKVADDTGAAALLDTIRALGQHDEEIAKAQLTRAGIISEAFKEMLEADPLNLALRGEAKRWVEFFNKHFDGE